MAETGSRELCPAGAWVELLGEVGDRQVVLVDGTGGPAVDLLRDAGADVRACTPVELTRAPPASAYAVVLAGVALDHRVVATAVRLLQPGGVLLLVGVNAGSPLAWADRLRRRSGLPLVRLGALRSLARAAGTSPCVEYGLLRSVEMPSTMIALHQRRAAAGVVAGSNTLNRGRRGRLVDLLRLLVSWGQAARVVPGLAVLCCNGPLPFEPLTGRIGVRGSEEVKLLYGDPPQHVDKVYAWEGTAAAEAEALDSVGRAWPGLAPALLDRRSPVRNRISWLPGRTLDVRGLSAAEGERWVLAAAGLLGELHRRLGSQPDGSVLVHGDFWLGNLLVDPAGQRITGVIDWTEARRGSADEDLAFLVDQWSRVAGLDATALDRLHAATRAAYEGARESGSG